MYEVVQGGYQEPQPWRYGIILIPQVTLVNSQIWGQIGQCNNIKVHP
jgi:hypothetical protein